ncbi:MAG TPA: hypothetical protein VGO78_01315 [Acidimicrobiales bacterium]|nr:hypothetical protein [Acidimicrobiales bacterium]
MAVGLAVAAAALAWPAAAEAAPAGPTAVRRCPETFLDRYDSGDEVTMLGYTEGCIPDIAEPSAEGQPAIRAYLHPDACADVDVQYCNPNGFLPDDVASGTPLGQVALDPTDLGPRGQRMRLTFRLPADLAPGQYLVMFCQDPCNPLLEPDPYTFIYVGGDAGNPNVHHWPLDEPAIADLPDDALLLGPDGEEITAAEARAIATTTTTTDGDAADRVELAPEAPDDDGDGDGLGPALWVPVVALVAGGGWLLVRRGSGRKRIRGGP